MAREAPEYREHFLERVMRLGDEAVDRVMGLWREGDALRDLVASVRAEAGRSLARPIAVQVDDGGHVAHVVVGLGGGLVTVLAPGMRVVGVDATVPWQAFEDARARVGARREVDARHEELRRRWSWRTVFKRIQTGPYPGREVMERALADPEVLRGVLGRGLGQLHDAFGRTAVAYNQQQWIDGAWERRLDNALNACIHASRLAGGAQVNDAGRPLSLLSLEPIPRLAAPAAVALARVADEHVADYKRIARDRSITETDSRLLATLVLGLTAVVRAKRAAEVEKVIAGISAAEADIAVVRATASWIVARLDGKLGADLPAIPPEPPDWPPLVAAAFDESIVPVLDRYLPEDEAAAARRDLETRYETMPRKRLEPGTPAQRSASAPGRNDPCPCGSGKKYKRCCAP